MDSLEILLMSTASEYTYQNKDVIIESLKKIISVIRPQMKDQFINEGLGAKNQFFRDIVSEKYNAVVETLVGELYEPLMLAFDKSITPTENEMVQYNFKELILESMQILEQKYNHLADQKEEVAAKEDPYMQS